MLHFVTVSIMQMDKPLYNEIIKNYTAIKVQLFGACGFLLKFFNDNCHCFDVNITEYRYDQTTK